jgi:hypothetical protein
MTPADLTPWRISPCSSCNRPAGQRCRTASGVLCQAHQARLEHFAGWLARQPEVDGLIKKSDTYMGALLTAAEQIDTLTTALHEAEDHLADSESQRVTEREVAAELVADLRAQLAALTKPEPIPGRFVEALDMTSKARMVTAGVGANNYWRKHFTNPHGESDKYLAHGGLDRDMPLERTESVPDWQMIDARVEIGWAKDAGLDGLLGCLLSAPGGTTGNWDRALTMTKAAAEDEEFYYTPLLDCTATFSKRTAAAVAADLATLYKLGAARKVDGEYLLHSFCAQKQPVSWWTDLKAETARLGYPVKVVIGLLSNDKALFTTYAPVAYAMGNWGAESPPNVAALEGLAAHVHSLGKKWQAPVRMQDSRPREDRYWESENTTLFRSSWALANKVTQPGDMVQVITWDDNDESTHIWPSVAHGFVFCELNKFYADWWRTGEQPAITEDKIVLTHRRHPVAAKPTMPGLNLMKVDPGSSKPRDTVEALVFATALRWVAINGALVGQVPAGLTAVTAPLGLGQQTAHLYTDALLANHGAGVTSPVVVTDSPEVQDMSLVACSS